MPGPEEHTDGCAESIESSVHPIDDIAEIARSLIERDQRGDVIEPLDAGDAASLPIGIPEFGVGESEALDRLRKVADATPTTSGPRFANQLFAGRERVAVAAEALSAVLNTSMYTFKAAGPQVLVEREVLERMLAKAGMTGGDGMFAPGGSMSNLAAMIIARNEAIEGAKDNGFDGRNCVVYTSTERHYSVRKNTNMIGVGRSNVRGVAVDTEGRLVASELDRAIQEDRKNGLRPLMVVATSGTTVMGAFDPLDAIADVCEKHGVWLHVDGAFGATALMNDSTRELMTGIERADSLTWDAHKAMGVPLTCSVVLTKSPGLTQKHFDESASYLFQQDFGDDHGWLNPGTRSLQCGRRNDSLKLWAMWQSLGDDGYASRVEKQMSLAAHAAAVVREHPEMSLTHDPAWLCICFEVEGKSSDAICSVLNDTGILKVGHGIVHGKRIIRLVTVDPSLTSDDIDHMIAEIARVARDAPISDNRVES